MLNLLKADFFRLSKSKTFRICTILMIIITCAFTFLYFSKENFLIINGTFKGERLYGFFIGKVRENRDYINFFRSSLGFTAFICIMNFFIVSDTVISKYNNGVLKNAISYGHDRRKLYLSNTISSFLGVLIISLLTISLSMLILCTLFTPENNISKNELIIIFKGLIQLLITLGAMTSVYTLIATIIKSKALVTSSAILFTMLGSPLLFDVLGTNIKNKIPIHMLLNLCGDPSDLEKFKVYIINSIIIILLSTTVGSYIFNNQDIK